MLIDVEDFLIAQTKALFGSRLKVVDSLPGDWDADMLKRLIISAPSVYIAFTGGPKIDMENITVGINSRWSFFAVTAHASGAAARRRGDSVQIGAYEIISLVIPHFDCLVVPDTGTMEFERTENLYSGTIDTKGVSLYACLFSLPVLFEDIPDISILDAFEEFDGNWDIQPMDGVYEAQTKIILPQ
jgi:phage gp37-like protein